MLASVFAMQPVGQFLVAVVALILIECHVANDSMWRWIFGLGAVPALFVLVLRAFIPESPRYTFDVQRNPRKANADISLASDKSQAISVTEMREVSGDVPSQSDFPPTSSLADIHDYFITQGNWRYLVATSGTWFLLDLSFYGLGLNSPQIIAKLWNGPSNWNNGILTSNTTSPTVPLWDSEPNIDSSNALPWPVFRDNAFHAIILVSLGAILGSVVLIWLVNHLSRKRLQIVSFLLLAVFFLVIGLILLIAPPDYVAPSIIIVILYVVAQFLFNLGG